MNNYAIEELQPFGAVVTNTGNAATVDCFSRDQIYDWIKKYRLIVFRRYNTMPKKDFALFGQKIGEPLQWPFGAINELKVKQEVKNYIYTDRAVPFHWDGAFVGKIPYIILFQCLKAPAPTDKGGTTFSDTTAILKDAPADVVEDWKQINVTYTTEKVVHYGGQITQRLVASHPVTGETVLRYAEPVADLNPVALNVKGLRDRGQWPFIQEMQALLYDGRYCYTHQWQDGDIVMADNHALLHGREAFLNPHERYIQRINILHRKPLTLSRFIKLSLTIRRKEFFVAELPIFFIPPLLCIRYMDTLYDINFLMGFAAAFLLFNIGDMINCYSDYELDAIYKSHLSNAVYELGKKNIMLQMALSGLLAFALTCIVAINTGQLYLIPLTVAGGFVGMQYSAGPFHFKNRGIWQLFCLWGIIFFGPMLYISIISNGFPPLFMLAIFAAYGFHQMGIILLNTAEDFTEDKQAGLRTVIIALGLQNAMRFAVGLIAISGLALQLLFLWMFRGYELGSIPQASILVFTAGWLYILYGFGKIVGKIKGKSDEDATKELKKNGMKVPEWLKIGAYSTLFIALVFFLFWHFK